MTEVFVEQPLASPGSANERRQHSLGGGFQSIGPLGDSGDGEVGGGGEKNN